MAKFGRELIESMQQAAAKHAVSRKASSEKIRQPRRTFATVELSDEQVQTIALSRMDERHEHLDDNPKSGSQSADRIKPKV